MNKRELILLDLPDQLETERMILRIPQSHDGKLVHPAFESSYEQIIQYLDWAHGQTAEGTERYIRQSRADFILRENFVFVMLNKETGEFIGMCSGHARNEAVPEYEIGYWQSTTLSGKGYMTEAVKAVANYLFTHLKAERVMIRCDKENLGSAGVARRAGFVYEGMLRQRDPNKYTGGLRDMLFFSMIRDEWSAQ
jgi:ribosomal-protein-serine acetyltransferase